jgi:hypothetical protein
MFEKAKQGRAVAAAPGGRDDDIPGLGGKVLKTNVDLERAKLIPSTLAAAAPPDLDR